MALLVPLLVLLAGLPPGPGGVPAPPDGAIDAALTKEAGDRAAAEMKSALAQLDQDPSRPASVKAELKRKIANMKVVVYTTPKSLDESVAFYEQKISTATFLFGERNLLSDADEIAKSGGFRLDDATAKEWTGKFGRSARWSRPDGSAEIDIEDHLVDPKTGKISKKTIVMVTALGE